MKPFLLLMATCAFLAGTRQAVSQTSSLQDLAGALADQAAPTTIYVAREFLTMDPARPTAAAIAVRNGKFVAVGTRAEVVAAVGDLARVDTTLADKFVTAGFIEQHVHPLLSALTMNTRVISIEDWDAIDGFSQAVRNPEDYERRLLAALKAHQDKTQTFVTWGYHHYLHGDQMSRSYLNRHAPDFPVIVWHRSCHEFYLNDSALARAGIDDKFFATMTASQKAQSSLERGHFYEQGALAILDRIAPQLTSPQQFKAGLEFTERYYHRNGITTCCEPGGFFSKPMQDMINSVYSDDATPFNHYFIADGKTFAARNPGKPEELIRDTEQVLGWGQGRTRYLPRQVKLLSDGAIFSQLMQMKEGYSDGHEGAWIMDPPVFDAAFQAYWDAGYQIHIHNNGDRGLDVLLASLTQAQKRRPRDNHRTVLVHFGFAAPEQVSQWARLGGIVSANPYYVTALAAPYAKINLGPRWSANMVPMGDVMRHQMSFSFHSDMPMAPAKPLELIWAATTRKTLEGMVMGPQHIVPIEAALRAMTIDAAYSIQLEQEIGSIEVGKTANLTVLDKHPCEVPSEELKSIAVWGTMLEGRVQPIAPTGRPLSQTSHHSSEQLAQTGKVSTTRKTRESNMVIADLSASPLRLHNDSARSRSRTNSNCGPGCSCGLTRSLGELLVRHWQTEQTDSH